MNRYRFRLDAVRRIRRVQEDLAIGAWRVAQGELHDAEIAFQAAEDRYRAHIAPAISMSASAFLAGREASARAADMVVTSQLSRTIASSALDDRRSAWSLAAQRVAGLDKLDERAHHEHALAAARSEAVVDDDRAAVAFRARHESSKGSR